MFLIENIATDPRLVERFKKNPYTALYGGIANGEAQTEVNLLFLFAPPVFIAKIGAQLHIILAIRRKERYNNK